MNYFSDIGNSAIQLHGFEKIVDSFYISDQLSGSISISPIYPDSSILMTKCFVDSERRITNRDAYEIISKNDAFDKPFIYLPSIDMYLLALRASK